MRTKNRGDQVGTTEQPTTGPESRETGKTRELLKSGTRVVRTGLSRGINLESKRIPYRSLIVAFEIVGGIAFVAFLAVLFAHSRLQKGPVSLSFLVSPIEQAINRELPDSTIRIGDAVVQYDQSNNIRFRLRNVSLLDIKGDVVAQAPRAAIRLSGAALLKAKIAPAIVEFIEPRILVFYSKENGFSLSFPEYTRTEQAPGGLKNANRDEPGGAVSEEERTIEISLTQTISRAFTLARRRSTASSYLTRFGLRRAVVAFEREGRQSFWQVPHFEINMKHQKKRSTISGQGRILSEDKDWGLNFKMIEFARKNRIEIDTRISDLIPAKLHRNLPYLSAIENITTPVQANIKMMLSRDWNITDADIKLDLGAGAFGVAGLKRPPRIAPSSLNFHYSGERDQITLRPSLVRWDDSSAMLSGTAERGGQEEGSQRWNIGLVADDVKLGLSRNAVTLDHWRFNGSLDPRSHRLEIGNFELKADGTAISIYGHVAMREPVPDIEISGKFDPMPVNRLKNLWPSFLMPDAHDWFQESVFGGDITRGVLRISTRGLNAATAQAAGSSGGPLLRNDHDDWYRKIIHFELDADNVEVEYLKHLPYLRTGPVKLALSGQTVLASISRGSISLPSGREITLRDGEIRIPDHFPDVPQGQIIFEADADAHAALELLDHKPLGYVSEIGIKTDAISGRVKGNIHLNMPLSRDVRFEDIKIDGRLNLEDGALKRRFGGIKVSGGSVGFGVTEKALEANGDILINGVPARLRWQRIFAAAPGRQPPIRVTGRFDDADRDQLGLELNHIVQGQIPVDLTITPAENGVRQVSAQADLTNAELIIENMAWRKPPGHTAILEFDIIGRDNNRTELQNFKIVGDNIAIDGWLGLNEKNRLDAFYFPEFSINLITHIEIEGKLDEQNVWKVKAGGTTFDGRNLFRSLFSAGRITEKRLNRPKDRAGIDLEAQIANVVGFEDTMVKDVSIKMSSRQGKMSSLAVRGMFRDNSPINVSLVKEAGKPRYLFSETKNAGEAFRLVGFYPSVIGGHGSLRVNMDGEGYAERIGTLWARNFFIRGDPVVGEVLVNTPDESYMTSPGESRKKGRTGGKVKYSKTQFDRLKMAFSVGQGQLVLRNSYINGPLIGATIRGRVDYDRKRLQLGGTYVPLYGLNSVVGEIPILGQLLVGRRGEGFLGITFAVNGPMEKPNVLVNPISVVTPGIFRQIFDMTPQTTKVRPRAKKRTAATEAGSKSSSAPPVMTLPTPTTIAPPPPPIPAQRPKAAEPDSWSVETLPN